ncbi:crotonobetaine/carnitine-CoA ligase [Thermomonospora echinospora]|uniref:Crotonobetaine/carnitine-CoA ligase n=1 Tax=Thermomonospora echinospora TaxID=1992 RepID=A0A1H6AMP4_9ACTN|nr:AMP-binding protein [Thermomonospora echinospora]SEG49444.1 crotonobetaine/carnitine-CoA ligase [Thermomonospora echinospora]
MNPFAKMLDSWLATGARLRVNGEDVAAEMVVGQACAVAEQLRSLGVDHTSHVATFMNTGTEALAVWFGSAMVGCLEVPLNTNYRGDLLGYLLRDSGVEVVFCDAELLGTLTESLPGTSVRHVLVAGDVPEHDGDRPVIGLAAGSRGESAEFGRWCSKTSSGVVLYTSGTTGPSKGVHHSQESCVELARAVARLNGYGSEDTLLNFFPLYHQNARYTGVGAALASGAGFQLDRQFSSSRFWDICRAGRVTAFNYLGSVLGMILKTSQDLDDREARDHSVRLAWGAGAPREVWAPFESRFGVSITEVYGLTEAPMATVNRSVDRSPVGSAGRESDLFHVQVVRSDGEPAAPGEVGQIRLRPKRSNIFMRGYLGRDADTVAATRDLWFHTGDAGWLSEDGDLFFADRLKDAIRRKGENISAWEIESVLLSHPDVVECAVYAVRPADAEEDEVMAAMVLRPDADGAAVVAAVEHRLPRYAVPRFVRVLPALPRTPTQKVEKGMLRATGLDGEVIDRAAATAGRAPKPGGAMHRKAGE